MKRLAFLFCLIAAPAFACKWLTLSDAWIRTPSGPNAAAYFTIENTDAKADAIVGASSDCCEAVELHTILREDGVMKMRPMERLDLAPGESAEFKPGSMHVMLIGLKQPLKAGDEVAVTFDFERAHDKVIGFPVGEAPLPGPAKWLNKPANH